MSSKTALKCAGGTCGCRPKAADPAVIADGLKLFERNQALAAALREPEGAFALDIAAKSVRWLSGGRQQEPFKLVFFSDDGGRTGYYDRLRPDSIFVRRGLDRDELVKTIAHETSHALGLGLVSEEYAEVDERWVFSRYCESLQENAS